MSDAVTVLQYQDQSFSVSVPTKGVLLTYLFAVATIEEDSARLAYMKSCMESQGSRSFFTDDDILRVSKSVREAESISHSSWAILKKQNAPDWIPEMVSKWVQSHTGVDRYDANLFFGRTSEKEASRERVAR